MNNSLAEYMANLPDQGNLGNLGSITSHKPINNNYGSFANNLQRASQVEYAPIDPRTISKFNPVSESLSTYVNVVNPLEKRIISTDTTLGGLASIYGSTPTNIQIANPQLEDLSKIYVGNTAYVPTDKDLNSSIDYNKYYSNLRNVESDNVYDKINKHSGAIGAYQFVDSTLNDLRNEYKDTFTNEEFLADKALQDKYAKYLTEGNAKILKRYGMAVNPQTLWAAHNLGPAQAKNLYSDKPLTKRTKKYIKRNLPKGMEPTKENYLSYYEDKF